MRRSILAALVILVPNVVPCQLEAQEETLHCPGSGLGSEYLVPNATAAKAIYRAVASAVVPEKLVKFPIIIAEDKGDHWEMGQEDDAPPPKPDATPKPGFEVVIMSVGGGQLYMDIDKCTGAISGAALNR